MNLRFIFFVPQPAGAAPLWPERRRPLTTSGRWEDAGMSSEGAKVIGTDVAWPMLEAARRRVEGAGLESRVALVRAPMDRAVRPS
jgi:hypothetical protein